MKDFQETSGNLMDEHGLFLIQVPKSLTLEVLNRLHDVAFGEIISLERLFKGDRTALVIFGPKKLLSEFSDTLKLLEIEDYTNVPAESATVWEVGLRNKDDLNLWKKIPSLGAQDQLWWQVVMTSKETGLKPLWGWFNRLTTYNLASSRISSLDQVNSPKIFTCQMRTVMISENHGQRQKLTQEIENLTKDSVIKIPRPFKTAQFLEFYSQRALGVLNTRQHLESDTVLKLITA